MEHINNTLPILKRILGDGRPYIPVFLLLGAIGLVMVPIEFYGLLLSRKLIDSGFMVRDWDTIKKILLVLIILFMLRSIIGYGTSFYSTVYQLRINQRFQDRLFSHILHLPLRFFHQEPTGQLMSRVLDDATKFSYIYSLLFGPLLLNPLKLIVLFLFLMFINVRLCLLTVLSALFSFLMIHWMGEKLRVLSKELQKRNATIYSFIEQILPNIELVKSKTMERDAAGNFRRLIDDFIQTSLNAL
ncbi:ABC transporter ATP-binding protein, partial [Deltaproteobacteria bacterium]|nr:ABC transporter ATP-binding protein [Deltaproteobacteria bacterium]